MRKRYAVVMALLVVATMFSCSSGRMNGFSYRPAQEGPDMGGSVHHAPDASQADHALEATVPADTNTEEQQLAENRPRAELMLLADIAREQSLLAGPEATVTPGEAVRTIADRYAAEKQVQLSPKQYRKLDRAARKMERKQADVNWGPENNLEIFLLAAAAVGLVVGIVGAAFGWFIFLVAALVYLYFKLLK